MREANPDARVFGVTATPNRGDKKGLREVFDNVADQVRLGELIASGHLVPPRAVKTSKPSHLDDFDLALIVRVPFSHCGKEADCNMRQVIPTISHQERDFDLLFIEEMAFGERFANYLLARMGLESQSIGALLHSVYENFGNDAWGETDIFVRLDGSGLLLIENKLAPVFQPDQASRYRARARHHESNGSDVRTVLIAPAAHLEGVPEGDWDELFSYAELADAMGATTSRSIWRQSLFREAGNRATRVRNFATSGAARKAAKPELIAFKSAWHDAIRNSGEWQANSQKGSKDEFLYRPRINPFGLTIWHHPFAGYLSVQVPKSYASGIAVEIQDALPDGFVVKRHPSTIYLDASVPEIDMSANFANEWDRVKESMRVGRHALDLVEGALRNLQ